MSFLHKILLFYLRQEQSELFEVMLADESNGSSSVLDSLGFLEETRTIGPCINFQDIEDIDCSQMFRYTSVCISQIQFA
jgi:hypothetical protein